jgi:hypothetical protein
MNTRYAVALIEIKERGIASIKKKKYIIFIVTEFYIKLYIFIHIRSFLLIKLPFSFEIVVFILQIRYDFKKIIQIKFHKYFVRKLTDINVFI